jgi:NTE family protein
MLPPWLNKLLLEVRRSGGEPGTQPRRRFFRRRKRLNLALQGGGAHGAFTWGVLDQLLADGRIAIGGLSGTSAGAVNAVMLADGLAQGGPIEAQQRLADFWRAASRGGTLPDLQRAVVERLFSLLPFQGSAIPWFGDLSRFLSPYDVNPLNINPLKDLIGRFVDFERLRAGSDELYITATNVVTGEPRVFARSEITAEVVMASACLPLLFRAVEIDGVPYWDGGYSGNPLLVPFLQSGATEDVLIVQINPRERHKVPTTAREIMTRVNEITFNAPLIAELRALELAGGSHIRLHRIVMDEHGASFDGRSRFNNDFEFFTLLHKLGQRATRRFLDAHFKDIGRRSTISMRAEPEAELV